ncbi:Geranylgeranyl pyrophosphate synthase [Balamuthia mandrillaris]
MEQKPDYDDGEILMEPFQYLLQVPGKDIRSKLINAFNLWLQIPEPSLEQIKTIVSMLHNSSLLIDDIEDNSKLRRGIPVAHVVYGVPSTINCANYAYFVALQKCSELHNHEANRVFLEEMLRLHHGQGYDIFWRDHQIAPTEEEYKKMVLDKTGGLFRLGVKMMQCFSEDKRDFIPLVNKLAVYFQIRDDYMNLQSTTMTENKGFCEDLTEGKYSFPIIHSIRSNPRDHRLPSILKQRTTDLEVKHYAVQYMKQTKSFEYTLNVLKELYHDVEREIESLGGNALLQEILVYLAKDHLQPKAKEGEDGV